MSQCDFAAKVASTLNFGPLWEDFPLILGASRLPPASSHGGSGLHFTFFVGLRLGALTYPPWQAPSEAILGVFLDPKAVKKQPKIHGTRIVDRCAIFISFSVYMSVASVG